MACQLSRAQSPADGVAGRAEPAHSAGEIPYTTQWDAISRSPASTVPAAAYPTSPPAAYGTPLASGVAALLLQVVYAALCSVVLFGSSGGGADPCRHLNRVDGKDSTW
ncbi:hypothetical protein GCM10023336_77510 [Streptomyces similanensis]|uniref:Uncharacterized protein n=1 Tax=Streptomyces similanensis TaxID=1274988 RepID=A0ABP9LTP1_9ACTN